MNSDNALSAVRISEHPILRILVSFPIACFSGALITDLAYARTADMAWADFSAWLLAVGIFMGVLTALAGIADLVANRRVRPPRQTLVLVIGSLLVLALGVLNNLVHSRDAWTSVVPLGLILSAVTVIIILITAWFGSGTPYRQRAVVQHTGVPQ